MIAYLWAQDAAGTIGRNGTLPWHLSDDLKFFKATTLGQIVVMGRKTFTGMGSRPLPGRTNLVLTRDPEFTAPGVTVVHDRAAVLAYAAAHPDQHLIIIGGAQVFQLFMADVDTLYVTQIEGTFAGDVSMPDVPWADFTRTATRRVENENPALNHTFETWERSHS